MGSSSFSEIILTQIQLILMLKLIRVSPEYLALHVKEELDYIFKNLLLVKLLNKLYNLVFQAFFQT